MKISDLFGRNNVYQNSQSSTASKADGDGSSSTSVSGGDDGSDRTTISSKARVLSQISGIRDDADTGQASRVADLKKKVESGEYNVSSQAVAEKLVAFFNERS